MPCRVGEGFLADSEECRSQLRFHPDIVRTGHTGAGNTGAFLKILALPLDGSDDQMLMATLRDGSPAPAPSKVMIASAKPFIAHLDDGKNAPSARSFTLASTSSRVVGPAVEPISSNQSKTKSLVRSASATEPPAEPSPPPDSAPAAFAPARNEALDLMSGRGLY